MEAFDWLNGLFHDEQSVASKHESNVIDMQLAVIEHAGTP